jgi:hypothetical protein
VEFKVPLAWRLLEAVEGEIHMAYIVRVERVLKSRRLLHVYWLVKVAIKKGCLEINLATFPVADSKETTDKTEGLETKSWGEYFLTINAMDL